MIPGLDRLASGNHRRGWRDPVIPIWKAKRYNRLARNAKTVVNNRGQLACILTVRRKACGLRFGMPGRIVPK